MLIDEVTIKVGAGGGGRGSVAFSNIMMSLGPTGGTGGWGGNLVLEAVPDLGALRRFRMQKKFDAEDGHDGRSAFRDGVRGEDVILRVPRGTTVYDTETKEVLFDFTEVGQQFVVAKGGRGGKGNFHFRSPTNTTPKQFDFGKPGEAKIIRLELKLIADIGIVGLPNIGKSSFLNAITNADSKVANYQFTTLQPHLGSYFGLVLADLPGLIEGASEGKGLGYKFLKHVERTKTIFHFVDAKAVDPLLDYEVIRKELGAYNKELLKKPEFVFISRADEVDDKRIKELVKLFAKKEIKAVPLSIIDDGKMKEVKALLGKLVNKKI